MRIVKLNETRYVHFMKMRWVLTLVLSFLLSSCSESFEFRENVVAQGRAESNFLDFSHIRSQIFEPHCLKCHREYGDYQTVRRQLDIIRHEVETGRMPKWAPALPESLKELLHQWYQAGAPE